MRLNKILFTLAGCAALLLTSCQEPEALIPSVARNGINSIVASFPDDNREENAFPGEIDYEKGLITIVVPYTYPSGSDTHIDKSMLTKMKMVASLDNNATCEPALLFMDLSKDDNFITITDQQKNKKKYQIVSEVRKSRECAVLSFKLVPSNVSGVINEGAKTISLIAPGVDLSAQKAEVTLSNGASIVAKPNPTRETLDYTNPVKFRVVAEDEITEAQYTVSVSVPETVASGMRSNSEKIVWKNNIIDYGMGTPLNTTAMAVGNKYIYLSTRGEDLIKINRATGEKIGEVVIPFKGSLTNWGITSDDAGNILCGNLSGSSYTGDFVLYKFTEENENPVEYLRYSCDASMGRRFSVRGSLDGDAIITAPVFQGTGEFYRWFVRGGVLDPNPEHVVMSLGLTANWNYNCDIVALDPTDNTSDYFVCSYAGYAGGDRLHVWVDGKTHKVKAQSAAISANWVPNAADVVNFNGVYYMATNSVNSFSWGSDDIIYLYDLSGENLTNLAWQGEKGIYGSWVTNSVANSTDNSDVVLKVTDDGCFMNLYFYFASGSIVCVQFDCLKM